MRASISSCAGARAPRNPKRWRSRERSGIGACLRYVALGFTTALAGVATLPVYAQQATQLATGIVSGAISCTPSNNGTAHLVCAQYSTAGAVIGTSWQTLPGGLGNTVGVEPRGQVDPPLTLIPAGVTLRGPPACAQLPVNDPKTAPNGTAAGCLVISSNGVNDVLQGIAFYPPTQFVTPLMTLDNTSVPTTANISAATCFTGNFAGNTANAAVLCVLVINDRLNVIGFNPQANTVSLLEPLSLGNGFIGAPSCAGGQGGVGICAVRQGVGLLGFTLNIGGTLNSVQGMQLGAGSYLGDPGCAVPGNGLNADGTLTAICAIVSGGVLLGISFDPQQPGAAPVVQSLGAAEDGGSWTGAVACTPFSDVRAAKANVGTSMISCGAVSNTSNLFDVSFDPRTNIKRGINGPFGSGANGKPSCISLFFDFDVIDCGSTTTAGASSGFRLPVGLLPGANFAPIVAVLH
jgi:hypothetical protein